MLSKTVLGIAGASVAVISYCIYFDHKRRSDPDFKKKLRERRRNQKQNCKSKTDTTTSIPDLRDAEAMQKFFLNEVQLGEELLASGDIEGGVEHLSNAVAVCGQPQQLLQVLQQTLPPQVFQMLIQRLPMVSQKIMSSSPMGDLSPDDLTKMPDDDLE